MSDIPHDVSRRSSQSTRTRILSVAAEHFAAKPYGNVPLKEIAQDAGVSAPLIIKYFGSKEDLFIELIDFEHMADAARETPFPQLGQAMFEAVISRTETTSPPLVPILVAAFDSKKIAKVVSERFDAALGDILVKRIEAEAPGVSSHEEAERRYRMMLSIAVGYLMLRASSLVERESAGTPPDSDVIAPSLQNILDNG